MSPDDDLARMIAEGEDMVAEYEQERRAVENVMVLRPPGYETPLERLRRLSGTHQIERMQAMLKESKYIIPGMVISGTTSQVLRLAQWREDPVHTVLPDKPDQSGRA